MSKLLSGIVNLIKKQRIIFTHSVCVIAILAAFFVPVNRAGASSASPPSFPQGWTAADPIIVSKTLQSDSVSPFVNPSGLYPAQIRKAYGIDKLAGTGAGKTIAIVDAYGDPNMTNDITAFDNQFGLPAANITTYGSVVHTATNWPEETALDVEWAHAIAPAAAILLVIAPSNSGTDLYNAIYYATNQGVNVVSMSWGGA